MESRKLATSNCSLTLKSRTLGHYSKRTSSSLSFGFSADRYTRTVEAHKDLCHPETNLCAEILNFYPFVKFNIQPEATFRDTVKQKGRH